MGPQIKSGYQRELQVSKGTKIASLGKREQNKNCKPNKELNQTRRRR